MSFLCARIFVLALSYLAIVAYGRAASSLQCRDDNNQPVDWYVLYKIPKISQSSNPLVRKGAAYQYMTSKTFQSGWQLSPKDISAQNSAPANTLAALYNMTDIESVLWVLYNDDPPNKTVNARYGHAKGIVMAKPNQGFWLIHSVPNYPPPRSGEQFYQNISYRITDPPMYGKYIYPTNGFTNGQSFLCISLNGDQFDVVGRQLMYNQIIVYEKNLPAKLTQAYPILTDAANQKRIRVAPFNHKALIRSSGSLEFTTFAKSDKWQRDLYDDFVAPQLQSDLYAETWLNGRGRLPSDCNGSRVLNVDSVVLQPANVEFKNTRDHSKWAVAMSNKKDKNWVCVGDINRADTQYNRGGGTVCFNVFEVWKNYHDSVNDVEPCPLNLMRP